ncbi:phage portal protein [Entomomonas asaccharolytica]|uniref:DUF1073 domain-containing protein n=1 Tax=Entomomonas asaccharolytica TaxID=2785331 RepID=A0A974NI63_9GAMM|nr:DUF1073 domain-containing protein [Entomomonas asaccharolytica]QQP86934.1 DUF1073 domain-containing protein [Entomomonas asaccharolytica]
MSEQTLNDSMMNLVTALGRKSESRKYKQSTNKSNNYWLNTYFSSWIAEKYIDKTARDMVKKWRVIETSDTESEQLKLLEKLEDKFKVPMIAEEALAFGSLFGEILILAITDITEDQYATELNLSTEKLLRFIVIDDYKNGDIDTSILSKTFGEPLSYTVSNIEIHASRVHRLVTGKIPFSKRKKNGGQGVSDLNSKMDIIKAFDAISTSVSDLVEECKIDVLKMKGLNNQIAAGQEDLVVKYAQLAQQIKSLSNMLLVDADDEYDQKEITFSGLSDLWVKAREVVAGAMDRPVTVMFGQSAAGFASGEEDNQAYYGTINSLQESRLRPLLDFTDQFLLAMANINPDDFAYSFPSIEPSNLKEESTTFATYSTGIVSLYQNNLITGKQALMELKQKEVFSNISEQDIENIKELEKPYDNQFTDPYQITETGSQQSQNTTY